MALFSNTFSSMANAYHGLFLFTYDHTYELAVFISVFMAVLLPKKLFPFSIVIGKYRVLFLCLRLTNELLFKPKSLHLDLALFHILDP